MSLFSDICISWVTPKQHEWIFDGARGNNCLLWSTSKVLLIKLLSVRMCAVRNLIYLGWVWALCFHLSQKELNMVDDQDHQLPYFLHLYLPLLWARSTALFPSFVFTHYFEQDQLPYFLHLYLHITLSKINCLISFICIYTLLWARSTALFPSFVFTDYFEQDQLPYFLHLYLHITLSKINCLISFICIYTLLWARSTALFPSFVFIHYFEQDQLPYFLHLYLPIILSLWCCVL